MHLAAPIPLKSDPHHAKAANTRRIYLWSVVTACLAPGFSFTAAFMFKKLFVASRLLRYAQGPFHLASLGLCSPNLVCYTQSIDGVKLDGCFRFLVKFELCRQVQIFGTSCAVNSREKQTQVRAFNFL
ncbi:hypothetical protein GOP47_0029571 [Adiantum capillus-veneris]|nr:hypothetical protein GOP47_0029571 [Adiantum capillus-veneris]